MATPLPCFLDTSAMYALFDRSQEEHTAVADAWGQLIRTDAPLVSTNYVLVELTALLQRRLGMDAVAALADHILPFVETVRVDMAAHELAFSILRTAARRELSLVDCSSFTTMRFRGVTRAFTLDGHFAEQGFTCIPEMGPS